MSSLIPSKQIDFSEGIAQLTIIGEEGSGSLIVSGGFVDFTEAEYVSGSFFGTFEGSATFTDFIIKDTLKYDSSFNFLIADQPNETSLIIGNSFNNYEFKQETTFKNGDVVVSGSTTITNDGILILEPHDTPPTPVSGGVYYSMEGFFFLGEGNK